MIGFMKSVASASNSDVETTLYSDNAVPTISTFFYYLKLTLFHFPLAIMGFIVDCLKFVIIAAYLLLKTCFLLVPFGLVKFLKLYVEHTLYVIIDSFTWPLNAFLGLKPLYYHDNPVNELIHGTSKLPFSLYIDVMISDILFPILLNGMILVTISVGIAAALVLFHKMLMIFHTEQMILTVKPFQSITKLFDTSLNDVVWIMTIIENTLKSFKIIVSPIVSIKDANQKQEIYVKEKKIVIQNGLKDYKQRKMEEFPSMVTSAKSKFFSAIKNKLDSSVSSSSNNDRGFFSSAAGKYANAPEFPEYSRPSTEESARSGNAREEAMDSYGNNKMNENLGATKLRRLSSIEIAETLPKDFFQNTSKLTGDITTVNGNEESLKSSPPISEVSSKTGTAKNEDYGNPDAYGLSKRKLKNKALE